MQLKLLHGAYAACHACFKAIATMTDCHGLCLKHCAEGRVTAGNQYLQSACGEYAAVFAMLSCSFSAYENLCHSLAQMMALA